MHLVCDARCLHQSMGGIGHATLHLIDHMCRSRSTQDQFTILTGPNLPDHFSAQGATVVQVGAGMIDQHFEQHQLPHTLDLLKTDVYLNMTFSVPAVAGRTAQVAVIHDVVFEDHPEFVEHHLGQYLRRWSRVTATVANRIITVSEDARRRIQRAYGISYNRIVRIYNGLIPIMPVRADDQAVADALRRHQLHPPYLIYLGSIEPKKGIIPLLHAWDDPKLEGVYRSLAMVGSPSGPSSDLNQIIERHRRASDIRMLGYVSDHDKNLLIAAAQTLVYPSLYEGFGLPPLEALAHGIPCVVHDGTSLPEIVGDIGVIVDVRNRSSFVNALIRTGIDSQLRDRVRRFGPGHAAHFRWDSAAQQYWKVCHQVWNEHQVRAAVA